jgi:methylaspartate ammonia-lyase
MQNERINPGRAPRACIADIAWSIGVGGYLHRDLAAIKAGAVADGAVYRGTPLSPGFSTIVEPASIVSVLLFLDDGQIAFGDCADVILAGIGGREPAFRAEHHIGVIEALQARLIGMNAAAFRSNAAALEEFLVDGKRPHTAVRFGLSQALLHAASLATKSTMARIVIDQYGLPQGLAPIPLLASCQRDDWLQFDRAVLKQPELLPHASFTVANEHVGPRGEKLLAYVQRVSKRIREIGSPEYRPRIHLDVYGTLGEVFPDPADLAGYMGQLGVAAQPFALLLESPIIGASRSDQIARLGALKAALASSGVSVALIADEWCNTLEDIRAFIAARACDYVQIKAPDLGSISNTIDALLECRTHGMGACLGGSANETDQSARVTAHVGLACKPDFMMTKPGLGFDEGFMIMKNEMARTIAIETKST